MIKEEHGRSWTVQTLSHEYKEVWIFSLKKIQRVYIPYFQLFKELSTERDLA